jgi:uncharacterized membrane protein YhaH (DUF805 family)
MDLGHLFTRFDGRINRAKCWPGAIVLGIVSLVVLYGSIFAGGGSIHDQDTRARTITLAVQLVFLYPLAALMVKRLHDRNRPGYFAAFILVPLVLKGMTDVMGLTGDALSPKALDYVFIGIVGVVGIWFFVDLGCLRGTAGPNKHGPDPLGGAPAR